MPLTYCRLATLFFADARADAQKNGCAVAIIRSTPSANFNGSNKEDIRLLLTQAQGAICAYCMLRISDSWDSK